MADVGGAFTATIPAGEYSYSGAWDDAAPYLPGIVDTWFYQVNTVLGKSWSIQINSSGGVDVVCSAGSGSVTWDGASDLARAVFGFSSNITTDSDSSDLASTALWQSDCPVQTLNNEWGATNNFKGSGELDYRASESRDGYVRAVMGQQRYVRTLAFPAVSKRYVWALDETVTGESFETFYRNVILAELSWARAGGPVGLTPLIDFSVFPSPVYYRVIGMESFAPQAVETGWLGRYRIELPRCMLLPAFNGE